MKSNTYEILIGDTETNYLGLYDIKDLKDNINIQFSIDAQKNAFGIRNHLFYCGIDYFKSFQKSLKLLYDHLEGSLELGLPYEEDKIKISAQKNGHIFVTCEVYSYSFVNEMVIICLEIDQTFLPNTLKQIECVYSKLGIQSLF